LIKLKKIDADVLAEIPVRLISYRLDPMASRPLAKS